MKVFRYGDSWQVEELSRAGWDLHWIVTRVDGGWHIDATHRDLTVKPTSNLGRRIITAIKRSST